MRVERPEKSIHFPSMEKAVAEKWDREKTFQRSIDDRPHDKKYNFYDGPPFATGLPHFGHFVPSGIKDAFPRYFTMKGYRVERRFGWDCHGLPVEMLIQKELGLNGRPEIEKLGVSKFNAACRESVLRYTSEWRNYMRRLGRWVDMDNEYRTMDKPFMESVWAVFKQLWDKGLVYEGRYVMSYSSALGSTLSNFEASLDYRDIQDPSVTLRARLAGKFSGSSLLVWTTTPWTLPANLAVAIDGDAQYCELLDSKQQEKVIILESRIGAYFKEGEYEVLRTFKGQDMAGVSYEPFFDYYADQAGPNAFKVYATNYVLHDTGTGAVHTAPAFGEDDFRCAQQYNLPVIDHLDVSGRYSAKNHPEVVGLDFKAGDKILLADLKKRGFIFKHDTLVHSYPMCYRSGLPLMYRAMPSWFVKVESIRDQLLASNAQINWIPDHIKTGRFGKWLENARDWNIARARYWGNPIPIWQNEETGEVVCLGSVAELEKYAGRKIDDLHMEFIDDITIPSPTGRGVLKRVPFVFDCWFESGSMPYAQMHYPFENKDDFLKHFPADFICEGLDQTRGWFYTLTVLSTALFNKPPFKNVVVNGLVLAADGRKMSKSLKNYPDPMATLDEYGADSVRLFLLNSPATVAEEVRFSVDGVKENTRRVLLPLWNAYSFFATYSSLENFDPEKDLLKSKNELDAWILLRLNELTRLVDESMTSYQIAKAVPSIVDFLDDLNNWYIRRSRRRFWNGDKEAFSTLFEVLVQTVQLLAPFAPFAAEYFFGKLALTKELHRLGSVHLSLLPEARALSRAEQDLLERVALARRVVELGRNIRTVHKLKNRQPLASITVGVVQENAAEQLAGMREVIADELNVKRVEVTRDPSALAKITVKPNFKVLGKALGERMKDMQAALAQLSPQECQKALQKQTVRALDMDLTPEMVTVELQGTGHQLVATDAELVAALDPTLTEELRFEGLAREVVSLVQKARKSANFEVEDRISLEILTSNTLFQSALEKNKAYIEDETLAECVAALAQPSFEQTLEIEGQSVTLKLKRR
ncbi:MAG: isoleucine--tRNA ligase [Proteobacteria bacterium]|nr:isoleucine--tRNA ligase [Pseudomonadota bacterium]